MQETVKKIPAPPAAGLLPIRTVSLLTGVNPVTLRAWERRYNLVTPQRTPKGHRLFTDNRMSSASIVSSSCSTRAFLSVMSNPCLSRLPGKAIPSATTDDGDIWKDHQDKMLNAIERFDEPALDSIYNDALSLYPVDIVNQRLTTPLLRLLGERWKKRETGIAEEHFFSVYLRNKLGTRIHHLNQRSNGPLLLLACLPGELHETGLLFFALAAVNAGYRVLILGANTPLQQIPGVLAIKPCAGIVLSSSSKPARGVLDTGLPELMGQVKVPVFVGGKTAVSHQQPLEESGIICLGENIARRPAAGQPVATGEQAPLICHRHCSGFAVTCASLTIPHCRHWSRQATRPYPCIFTTKPMPTGHWVRPAPGGCITAWSHCNNRCSNTAATC